MTKIVTDDEFVAALTDVVKSHPDYVYIDHNIICTYFDPETAKPKCLIGHVFDRFGAKINKFYNTKSAAALDLDKPDAQPFTGDVRFALSDAVIGAARDAQFAQDNGASWADAYKAFNKSLNRTYNEEKMMSNA